MRAAAKAPANLYWCTTPDHSEDWFVVARTERAAERYHERAEGYDRDDAVAELVCELPASVNFEGACWPSEEALRACGAETMTVDGARIVRIGDRLFGEGTVVANVAVQLGLVRRQ
jgi:hypothetical protein